MRILSWNVNGIRTLSQYHPWYTLKTCEDMLKELGADILCFQEMKISRQLLTKHFALPGDYDAVMSFPKNKGGYSGVAVYTNSTKVVPFKAEEGLGGENQATSKVNLDVNQRISATYPDIATLELMPDALGNVPTDLATLDNEGRALVVDFGLFVLINVYCPNEASDERLPFKYNFHKLLEDRVQRLIHEGREVIVLGDLNVVATPLDHCEGSLESRKTDFWERPVRAWFRQWLHPEGPMVDVARNVWPEREKMFTCWETRTNARESNYGTRIDYVLLTKGLLPWFKHGDIQPDVRGSDHCPIFVDLHDEITLPDGQVSRLVDKLGQPCDSNGLRRDPPPISTKFWGEFSGKQKLLSTFFAKKSATPESTHSGGSQQAAVPLILPEPSSQQHVDTTELSVTAKPDLVVSQSTNPSQSPSSIAKQLDPTPSSLSQDRKRKVASSVSQPVALKSKKSKKAQANSEKKQPKLATFFTGSSEQPGGSKGRSSSPPIELLGESDSEEDKLNLTQPESSIQISEISSASSSQPVDSATSKLAWSQLMKPLEPPRCTVHNAPTKEYTVNKTGPNKGKKFFLCSMPMGPGYDSGKSTRLREEVDPRYRCNYFKWASDVRKESKVVN
ncbi:DNase I-like protein [Ceratobasidium sp. AG-I]|nr:DNase I-like protein [Ceratobasidium sp. AG-I]